MSLAGMGFDFKHISPLARSCWGFSFALGCGISFFGGIQHSPIDSCSAESFNFGVLTGEDECRSFYSTVYIPIRIESSKELKGEIRKLSSVINGKK